MQLLLPSAKSGVMVEIPEPALHKWHKAKIALAVLGILVVLGGTLDLISRMPAPAVGDDTLRRAFAPLGSLSSESDLHNP